MPDDSLHIFGVRHHGPGSARSLRVALEALKPDCVLVEGPPDADEVLPLLAHKEMKPPVALLVYRPDRPRQAVYYPFAVFSPEWQAIHYALGRKIPVRFMDLPQAYRLIDPEPLALPAGVPEEAPKEQEAPTETSPAPAVVVAPSPDQSEEDPNKALRRDPLGALAKAAGYDDSERWWEHMVEERLESADLFAAILEAMTALREQLPASVEEPEDLRREAHMRQTIRAAQKEGFERIAVVCGAWHAPVLANMPPAKDDAALLKGLAKAKVSATWVPWTYGRLTFASGYGAGIRSPGWYHHLWTSRDKVVVRWMTRVARLLREQDLDCSSAHVIESVRLAETLAALRGRPLPGLAELNEASRAIFCFDSDSPMRLIAQKLIVGETLGEVPEETPAVPLQQDVQREQKRLRLPPEALEKVLELDLRKEGDLDRSRLLHRLGLLGVPWGEGQRATGKGTFKEHWRLRWQPELAVAVIEAAVWGNTVLDAATAFARDAADKATELPSLTKLLEIVLLADLPAAIDHLMDRLQAAAAMAADMGHLMDALPSLATVLRYGNVRKTDLGAVQHVVDGLVARVCVGLGAATASLNDDAAGAMFARIMATHGAITLLQNPQHVEQWQEALARLADADNLHGLIAGRATWLLHDAGAFPPEESARRMGLALSPAQEPARAAAWIDGFLRGSGLLLIHDDKLWGALDRWVSGLAGETFTDLLPLLRRTFSTFEKPSRRMMGERAKRGMTAVSDPAGDGPASDDIDPRRAELVLPVLRQILGVEGE